MVEVFTFFLCHYLFKLCLILQNYVHLHYQRSPDKCFDNSSWTHYNVTVHYVGTHSILTFFAFFKFLSLFHFAVLGSVSSSFVAVILIGIMSYDHCPWSLSSSYMPSNSAASSLARSVDNAVVAVLLPWLWTCYFLWWYVCWSSVWWNLRVLLWLIWLCWSSDQL